VTVKFRPNGSRPDAPRPLTEDEFQKAVEDLISDAEDYADANWRGAREDGWKRYKGHVDTKPEPGGDETIVAEVRDAVQQLMPEIMEQLAGSEEPVEYYSNDPQKAGQTKAATQLAIGIWWEGGGWTSLYDAVMHAAVGRIGALKIYRHEKLCMEEQEVAGQPEELDQYEQTPGYAVLEREDIEAEAQDPMTGAPVSYVAHSVGQVRRYYVEAELRIDAPFPGEIICTSTADPDSALCIGQKSTVRMADLRAMGIELDELEDIRGYDDTADDERASQTDEARQTPKDYGSWALQPVTLYEVYILIDANGDGLLERWKVIAAGDDKTVLRAEQRSSHDDQPYVLFPYRRSPQTIQGLSVSDLTWDLMESKTKLTRGMIDNVDTVNNPMMLASGTVNWASLQTWRRNKVVDERTPNSVRWFAPPPTAGETLPVLQYLDTLTEQRIGAGRAAQGLQPDSLTSVAAVAVAGAQAAAQRAIRLTVRTIAELGLRPAFSKLLSLMVSGEHPRPVVGEDGKYQVVDPRAFDPTFGVRTRVGLGTFSAEEKKQAYATLVGLVAQVLGAPPPYSNLTSPDKVALLLQDAMSLYRGLGAGRYFTSPDEMQQLLQQQAQQPPPKDPKFVEAEGKLAIQGQKAQADAQMQGAKLQTGSALQVQKMQADTQSKGQKAWLDYNAKMAAIAADERTNRIELMMEKELEQMKIKAGAPGGQGKLPNVNRR
jgi:hypothetical protein